MGQILGKYWANMGQILDKYWANIRQILGKYWGIIGQILGNVLCVCIERIVWFRLFFEKT